MTRTLGGAVHAPVGDVSITKSPFRSPLRGEMQPRQEVAVTPRQVPSTPVSPSTVAALTSHPVVEGQGDGSSDKHEMLVSEKEGGRIGYLGTK